MWSEAWGFRRNGGAHGACDTGTNNTMTNTFRAAALAATAVLGLAGSAASAATATATAKAKILKQVSVTKTSDLDYATIVSSPAASTVIVATDGTRTCGAGLTCTGTTTAAGFGVVGTTGQVVTVTVPATVSLTSGTNTMTSTLLSSAATLTLTGTDKFTVGGTLAVGANQIDGNYAGTFNVTVDYQ